MAHFLARNLMRSSCLVICVCWMQILNGGGGVLGACVLLSAEGFWHGYHTVSPLVFFLLDGDRCAHEGALAFSSRRSPRDTGEPSGSFHGLLERALVQAAERCDVSLRMEITALHWTHLLTSKDM